MIKGKKSVRSNSSALSLDDPYWRQSLLVRFNFDFGRTTAVFLAAAGLLLRLLVALHPYSGAGKAPRHGDFEAQRHWMEITLHTPPTQWYVQTDQNDLAYWGLDYPPLSAYLAWALGWVANRWDPAWVRLGTSRGVETEALKTFMRLTVLLADVLVLFPAWLLFLGSSERMKNSLRLLSFICPALVLVDHGHFQYNNVMLGLVVLAAALMVDRRRFLWTSVLLTAAICFKQTAFCFVLPFGFYMLRECVSRGCRRGLALYLLIKGVGLLVTVVSFWPFLGSFPTHLVPVLQRVFPFGRGLFEDKVASFWCVLAIATKFHLGLGQSLLVKLCAGTTLAAMLPSLLNLLFAQPTRQRFLYALAYCSLCFFLFSFHVHEKTIILPLTAVLLLADLSPVFAFWFGVQATFSLYPLMAKDELRLAYFACLAIWCFYGRALINWTVVSRPWKLLICMSFLAIGAIHLCDLFVSPPSRYPHLFFVANVFQSALAFGLAALYLLVQQYLNAAEPKQHLKLI